MLISTKNGKTGIVRAIALAICVVMLVAFAAGCSDEHAQSLANAAQTAADQAAEAAKQAQEAAKQAQGTADQAIKDAASANSNASSKFTEAQVEAAILEILKDYVKAEDAATKAELDAVAADLTKFLTEDAVNKLIEAAAASKDDLDAAKQEILGKINDAVTKIDACYTKVAVDALLEKYYTSEEIDTALADYYVKSKVEELVAGAIDPTELAAAIGTSEEKVKELIATYVDPTELATELDKYYDKTEIDAKFLANEEAMKKFVAEQLEDYVTEDDLADQLSILYSELYGLGGRLTSLQNDLTKTADKVLADAKAYADSLVNAYNDLTIDVVDKYFELKDAEAAYIAANKHLYDEAGLAAVARKYEQARVLILRATSIEAINAVMTSMEGSIGNIDTILDQLYDALVAVESTKIEGVNGEKYISIAAGTSTMDSGEAIDACLALLDKALANGISVEELNAYPEMALETTTKAYDAEYTRLENAKFAADKNIYNPALTYDAGRTYYDLVKDVYTAVDAATVNETNYMSYYVLDKTAVNTLVDALKDWADYKEDGGEDGTKTIEALSAKLNAAKVAYYAWMDEYFEAYEDEANPNIANLVPGWSTTYQLASDHWLALTGLGDLVADYIEKIDALLKKTGWDPKETVLYTDLGELSALADEIWTAQGKYGFFKAAPTLEAKYNDLVAAKTYANKANDYYLAFIDTTNGKSVHGHLVDLVALDLVITNYEEYVEHLAAFEAWLYEEKTVGDETVNVQWLDTENQSAIINSQDAEDATENLEDLFAASSARFYQLNDALTVAEESINSEIAKFYEDGVIVVNYDDMDKLDAILESIDQWLKKFNIAAPDAEGNYAEGHYEANYNMVDHDELEAVIKACQAKIDEVLDCEHLAAFKEAITHIMSEDEMNWSADDKQLYFYDEYWEANDAYTAWTDKWDIEDITLEKFNGGVHQDAVDRVAQMYKQLITVGTAVDNELKLATEKYTVTDAQAYADFKAEMAKLTGDYVPSITGSEWVVAAYKAASEWATAHTDATGFTAEIDAFGLLTGEEYNAIVEVYNEYIELVGEATGKLTNDAKDGLVDKLSAYFTLTEGVYEFNISLIDDVLPLKTLEGLYRGAEGVTGWLADYGVTDEANITDADLKALAQQFDTDLTAVMTKLKALMDSFEADLAALNFDFLLELFESDKDGKVINLYSNYFGELKALRDAYNAFADKYFEGENTSEALASSKQFTALIVYVKRLEAIEEKVRLIEAAKKTERQEIVDAIKEIIDDGITTDDKVALEAARKALDAWMKEIKIDYEQKYVQGIYHTLDIKKAAKALADAEKTFKSLMDDLKAAKDAIAALGAADSPAVNYSDDTALNAYKALYEAAKAAYDKFVEANGSRGTATLADDLKITDAEYAILENGLNEVEAYTYLCEAQKAYINAVTMYIEGMGLVDLEDDFKHALDLTIANIKRLVAADDMVTAATKPALLASELKSIATEDGSSGNQGTETDDKEDDTYPEGTNP